MDPLSLPEKLLNTTGRLFPLAVLGCDLGVWLLVVPGKLLMAL